MHIIKRTIAAYDLRKQVKHAFREKGMRSVCASNRSLGSEGKSCNINDAPRQQRQNKQPNKSLEEIHSHLLFLEPDGL